MKVVVNTKELKKKLKIVRQFTSLYGTHTKCIRFCMSPIESFLEAFDWEKYIRINMGVSSLDEKIDFLAEAQLIYSMIDMMTGDEITIIKENFQITLKSNKKSCKVLSMDEHMLSLWTDTFKTFNIDSSVFAQWVRDVLFAIPSNNSLVSLTGVSININNWLEFFGSNWFKLALSKSSGVENYEWHMIMPKTSCASLLMTLEEIGGDISVWLNDTRIVIKWEWYTLVYLAIQSPKVWYEPYFALPIDKVAIYNATDIENIISMSNTLHPTFNTIYINGWEFKANNDISDIEDSLDFEWDFISIKIDYIYLIWLCKFIWEEKIKIGLNSEKNLLIIKNTEWDKTYCMVQQQ